MSERRGGEDESTVLKSSLLLRSFSWRSVSVHSEWLADGGTRSNTLDEPFILIPGAVHHWVRRIEAVCCLWRALTMCFLFAHLRRCSTRLRTPNTLSPPPSKPSRSKCSRRRLIGFSSGRGRTRREGRRSVAGAPPLCLCLALILCCPVKLSVISSAPLRC